MDKRIMVFTSLLRDQEELKLTLERFLSHDLKTNQPVDIQRFSTIDEPTIKGCSLGKGGEILVVFDRRLLPREDRFDPHKLGRNNQLNKTDMVIASYKMQKDYCFDHLIPCITYEGEIQRGLEEEFLYKLNQVKKDIEGRLYSA